eukprot:3634816-Pleurochrysis_carterae.AAC.1
MAAATADLTEAVATASDPSRPSFSALLQDFAAGICAENVESLAVGSFAPVYFRNKVQDPWLPCVLLRQTDKQCTVFDSET